MADILQNQENPLVIAYLDRLKNIIGTPAEYGTVVAINANGSYVVKRLDFLEPYFGDGSGRSFFGFQLDEPLFVIGVTDVHTSLGSTFDPDGYSDEFEYLTPLERVFKARYCVPSLETHKLDAEHFRKQGSWFIIPAVLTEGNLP